MNIKVRLEQHTAKRKHPQLGVLETKLPQYRIFASVDDQPEAHVGYVGTKPNSPINLIISAEKELADEIGKLVRETLPTASESTPATAPDLSQLQDSEVDDEIDDEADGDGGEHA